MRIAKISFGSLTDGRVKIECVQDVFGLPSATFSQPTDSSFTPITNAPANSPFRLIAETNYWTIIQDQGENFVLDPLDGYLLTAASQPSSDAINYRFWTDESGDYEEKESADFCPTATITGDLSKATGGVINITIGLSGLIQDDVDDIPVGSICQINDELMEVVALTTTEGTFGRAVADSAIDNHASGDRIFFWGDSFYGSSTTLYQDTDSINVKITPVTAQGELDVDDATVNGPLVFDQRAYRAWVPGDLKLETAYFPSYLEGVQTLSSTWAHRDRTLQTAGLDDFTTGSIGPEVGTTYTTTLIRTDTEATLDSNTGLTGTSDTLDAFYDGEVRFEIKSVRDALDSYYIQTHTLPITQTEFLIEETGGLLLTETGEYIITES
jgi:hypothetical protein